MTPSEIKAYTDYLSTHNIFKDSEVDVNEFLYKMVSFLYNMTIDEESMRTIEKQTNRFLNWFFISMGIEKKDVETLTYQTKLKMFPRLIPLLKAKGSTDVINHYINLILSLGLSVNVYFVSVTRSTDGTVAYEFIPHKFNKNVPLMASKSTLQAFLFKHRDSLEDYAKSNVFPVKTNIIYYDYVGVQSYDTFPDWVVDVWIRLNIDETKQIYLVSEKAGTFVIDAKDLVDIVYYIKFHQRKTDDSTDSTDTNDITWLSYSDLKPDKTQDFLNYFEILATTDVYTRQVTEIREGILQCFEKQDSLHNKFNELEEKYPTLKDHFGYKINELVMFELIRVLETQSFLKDNSYPELKHRWLLFSIGSIIEFNTVYKNIVEPIKDLFHLYFLPVYAESINNVSYSVVMKSIFQNMFLSDKLNSHMLKTFVDKTLTVNNEFHVDFETIWKDIYHKMLDLDEIQMLSLVNEQSRVNDKFVYVIQFFMQELINHTKTTSDYSSTQMETFAKELINDDFIRDKLVAFVMREVFEHLITTDDYELLTTLTSIDHSQTKNKTLLEVTLKGLSNVFKVAEIHEVLLDLWKNTQLQTKDRTLTTSSINSTEERTNFKQWMIVLQQFVMKELIRDTHFTEQFKIAISWAFNEQLKLINQELTKLTSQLTRNEDLLWTDQNNFLTTVNQHDLNKVVSKLSDDFGYLLTRLLKESLDIQTKNRTTTNTSRNEETELTDDVNLLLNSNFNEWIKNEFTDEVAIYATKTYKTNNQVNEEFVTQVSRWITENSLNDWNDEFLVSLEQKFKELLLNANSENFQIYLTKVMKDLTRLIEETKVEVGLITQETQDRTDKTKLTLNSMRVENFKEVLKEKIELFLIRLLKEDLRVKEEVGIEVELKRTNDTMDQKGQEELWIEVSRELSEWIREDLSEEFEIYLLNFLREGITLTEDTNVRMDVRETEDKKEVDEVIVTSVSNQTNRVHSDVDVPMIELTPNKKDDAFNRDDDFSVEIT